MEFAYLIMDSYDDEVLTVCSDYDTALKAEIFYQKRGTEVYIREYRVENHIELGDFYYDYTVTIEVRLNGTMGEVSISHCKYSDREIAEIAWVKNRTFTGMENFYVTLHLALKDKLDNLTQLEQRELFRNKVNELSKGEIILELPKFK